MDKTLPSLTATSINEEVPHEIQCTEEELVAKLVERIQSMPGVTEKLMGRLKSVPEIPSAGNVVAIDSQVIDNQK